MRKISFNEDLSSDINKQLDQIIPVNPLTGVRDNIIHQYELDLTAAERSNLEQYLEVQKANNPDKQLSDSELIALCPSRFVQTLSDVKSLAKQMRKVVSDMDDRDNFVQEHNLSETSNPNNSAASVSSSN